MHGRPYRIAKPFVDLFAAVLLLVLLSPLLLTVALLIFFSSAGPVLFRQKRLGVQGRTFWLLKFRTMYAQAPDVRNPDGSTFNSDRDPRVTPVGRWLRRTSLDELPQLFNVLRGDMSLVGPRPDQADQLRFYTEQDKRKLLVKPGLTGLAQISGRNRLPWAQRKRLDFEYVERQSLWLDLSILLRTVPYVLLGRGVNAANARGNADAA